jgi:DNA-binding MarR family transcriptional regulator
VVRLSKNQKKILEILEIKPEMTTKEIAEIVFGRLVEYKTKEYSSTMRSLVSLERQGLIERVHVQLRWRRRIPTQRIAPEQTSR